MSRSLSPRFYVLCAAFLFLIAGHAAAHQGIHPPKKRSVSNYRLELAARSKESRQLRETLATEGYRIPKAAQQALSKVEKRESGVPSGPEGQREKLAQYDRALNGILRYDETTELKCTPEGLVVVRSPKRLRLTAEVSRFLPVIVENATDERATLQWAVRTKQASLPANEIKVPAGGFARLFMPLRPIAGQRELSLRFELDGSEVATGH